MSKRLKILYLVGTDPRNTSYGGEQRTHFIWEGLKKVADVHTVIPVAHTWQERIDEANQIRWVKFERRWTPGWVLRRIWSRFFPRVGLPCCFDKWKRYSDCPFDICVVRYCKMASYLRAWKIAPVCLDSDDLLTDDFDSRHSSCLRWHERMHRTLLSVYQNYVFSNVRHVWVANTNHLTALQHFSASCLPNIPPQTTKSFETHASQQRVILFVGLLAFDQNYLSVDRFVTSIWDVLVNAFPDIRFKIIGGGLPQEYKDKWETYRNIDVMGFVKDVQPLFAECMAVAAPLWLGSGTSIKVLEALNMGRVCFVTPIAARGIPPQEIRRENGLFLFGSAVDMIDGLSQLEDADVRRRFQKGGKQFVTRHYSQEKVDEIVKHTMLNM